MRPTLPVSAVIALLSLTFAAPAQEPPPMTPLEFEAYATGKTLTYARDGLIWGTEQYLPGRAVVWAFTADECRQGVWYPQGPEVCFVYEDQSDPQCWLFFLQGGALLAQHRDDPDGLPLSEVGQSTGPMPCAGPDVGV